MKVCVFELGFDSVVSISCQVRGFQVAPAELEGCILDHPYAADVCVVGVPHLYNGEVPLAFVVLTAEGLKAAEAGSQIVTSAITKVILLEHSLILSD